MKEVTFAICGHTGTVEDSVVEYGGQVMDMCERCKAVTTPDQLFVEYPASYRTQYGKSIMAKVIKIDSDIITVATSQFQQGQLSYAEWAVNRSDFRKKGQMLVADPFHTVK